MIEAKVDSLALDITTNSPVVILSPIDEDKVLPIWIGHSEAWAIAMELSNIPPQRPMTHDLLKMVVIALGAEVDRIEITELREQTFYARIYLNLDGKRLSIDSRPSDSIALALKAKAPILVNEDLLNMNVSDGEEKEKPVGRDPESLKDRLKRINPEDFGKYSL